MLEAIEKRRIWPTIRERAAWAARKTPELHNWRKAIVDAGVPFILSLVILRHFLDPSGWKDELTVGLTSLVIGLVVPTARFLGNLWSAPRQILEAKYWSVWNDYVDLRVEQERLLAERIEVEIGGVFVRRANLPGSTEEHDGKVYALQNTIITNRSDTSVSLSFELWMPNTKHDGAWLMIREHEHSGIGREDSRYAKSPINIAPRASSECKDIGFLLLPRDETFLPNSDYDHHRAVLRVLDRITKKTFDVPVRQSRSAGTPPGWKTPPHFSIDT